MSRIGWLVSLVVGSALSSAGCDDGGDEGTGSAPSRVVGVQADDDEPDLDAFCDVHVEEAGEAKKLEMPPIEGETEKVSGKWHWVNVWATWCKPCIEEMPMLLDWERKLADEGKPVEITFMSVDDSAEKVEKFREEHPDIPDGPRLTEQDALEGWVTGLGMDPGATIPLQVFADEKGRVRCVRSGAVNAPDYRTVKHLLGS